MIRNFLVCALLAAAGPALAVDGLPDSSFGVFSSGRNLIAIDQGTLNIDQLAKTLVNADGSILLIGTSGTAGNDTHFSITKLSPKGLLDLSFGNGGTVLSQQTKVIATSAGIDGSGNIYIAGSQGYVGTDRDFYVCKYNQQGLALAFSALGTNCKNIDFDVAHNGDSNDVANDLIVEPDGKIFLAGFTSSATDKSLLGVVRLLPSGLPDTTFATEGRRTYSFSANKVNRINSITRAPDGKYWAAGESGDAASSDGTSALVMRLTSNGFLDPTYENGQGYELYPINEGVAFNRNDSVSKISLLADGSVLMAGSARKGSNANQHIGFVIKLLPSDAGISDPSFGINGRLKIDDGYDYTVSDMLLQSDGKIVLVGTKRPTSAVGSVGDVIRTSADGNVDTTEFGTAGHAYIDFNLPGGIDYSISGAFQSGHILIGGYSLNSAPANFDLTITRLHNDLIFANGVD